MNRPRASVADMADRRYWIRAMGPLSIERPRPAGGVASIDARAAAREVSRQGFARFDAAYAPATVRRLRRGVEALAARGWPPVFLALCDQFWQLPRSRGVAAFLRGVLGRDCHQSPNIWVHTVPARRDARGWAPHRDHANRDRLTVWVPLTRAGVDDGCITVLPPDRLPRRLAGLWRDIDTFSRREVLNLLHAARPLPAAAGALVCWRSHLLHWGSARANTREPRIACSMEFSAHPIDPAEIGMPSIALDGPLPSFDDRLRLVSSMVLLYSRRDPLAARVAPLMRQLLARTERRTTF